MKRILVFALLLSFSQASAQPEERLWMFGDHVVLDFATNPPQVGTMPNSGGGPPYHNFQRSGAVCDQNGQLLFWVKLLHNPGNGGDTIRNVLTASGFKMPNSDLVTNLQGSGVPLIVPAPANAQQYYIFYVKNGALLYSVLDMTLNNGQGDILPGKKNLRLTNWSTVSSLKLMAAPGCTGIWVVVRNRTANEFFSFKLTDTGVYSKPAVSEAGTLPLNYYEPANEWNTFSGVMKLNPAETMVAVASNGSLDYVTEKGGLELFDFEKCSGKLSNPRLLDTGSWYGVCFSPDGSKLYATKIFERTLYQFDLSLLPNLAAVSASKTLLLTNPSYGTMSLSKY